MQATRPLLVVMFLALFAIVGVWMLGFRDPAPVAPPSTGANPTAGAGNVERSDATQADPGVLPETSSRTEAPAGQVGASAGAGTGPALVGQVLDERASPVVGAVVTCSPGFGGGFDLENLEAFDFEAGLDPDAWRERLQGASRERTETATDAEGRFRLAAAGQGRSVQLRVRAPSHVVLDKSVTRPAGKDSDLGVLTLKSGAIVAGRVLDRAGSPVVGARVSREDENEGFGPFGDFEIPGGDDMLQAAGVDGSVTDAEGRFSLPYCAPGKFALRARHPDHPSARLAGLAVEPGARLTDVLIVAEPGASIRGRIVGTPEGSKPLRVMASVKAPDGAGEGGAASRAVYGFLGDTGELMADAGLGIGEKQVLAGPDQSFELRGLQVGKTYRVWATQTGRGFAGTSACTERSEVAAGTVGLELHYDAGISVTFQVVSARSGEPVEKMAVRDQLRGGNNGLGDVMNYMPRGIGGRPRNYPEGNVTLANLRPKTKQTLSLTIEALGFATLERKDIALPATGTFDLGTLKLDPAPVLQVTVTSGAEQRPVAGASVRLTGATQSGSSRENPFAQLEAMMPGAGSGGARTAKTDAEGRCTLNALAGAMVVSVTSKEFAPYASEPLTLQPRENGSHAVVLVSGGTVEVTVVDSSGAFLRDSRIEHAPPSGSRGSRQTNQDGVALFEHLAPGAHRFRLGKGGQGNGPDLAMFARQLGGDRQPAEEADWQAVLVEDAGKATLQLSKDPTASLRGIVRENGVPLAGARVSFSEGLGNGATESAIETRVAGALEQFGGGGNRSARSDKDGNYQLADLPAGAHRLRITATGRVMPTTMIISLRNGENVVDVELDVTIVRGTVRDGAGQPVAGAAVSIGPVDAGEKSGDRQGRGIEDAMAYAEMAGVGGGRSAVKTGNDGRYELRGVQPGKAMQVRASAKGYAPAVSGIVEVAQGLLQDGVDVQLGAAGRIKVTMAEAPAFATVQGRLLGADGTPDASVTPVMQMMRRGAATLDGLRPGRWSVRVTVPGGEPQEPRIVEVTAGETSTLSY